ncbi:MAG TPA: hypothetical protein VNT26_05220, partial [Candidatus Sulfotelmatobacter sp.]|nr:hypothetical protein [Candidatus Sulfotelmatobacter sp.]
QCQNNLRQLTMAWQAWASDNNDLLLTCKEGVTRSGSTNPPYRVNWVTGWEDFSPANPSSWDPNQDLVKSPLWPYIGQKAALFKCPSDLSSVTVAGVSKPRVRSLSMSHVFSRGEWLPNDSWRTYEKGDEIRLPAHTFVFLEEHPASINDGAFFNACTGNEPGAPHGSPVIIDLPAAFHIGGCGFAFADGHTEIHRWQGASLRAFSLPIRFEDDWPDMQWLTSNTTVRR